MTTAAYVNGYRPFDFTDLSGGLNLRDKSDALSDKEAIDLLNVTFSERGAVRQREGFVDLGNLDLAARIDSMTAFQTVAGLRQMVAGLENGTLIALDQNGALVATSAVRTPGNANTFARFGDPTHEYLYAADGVDPVARWDGAAFASGNVLATVDGVAGRPMPRAGAVCVTAAAPGSTSGTNASNRLVCTAYGAQTNAGPGGTQSTPSRVHMSNAGQPQVFETDGDAGSASQNARGRNFVDLTPGDGEQILTAVTWRELTFIFKETKFFVYWGEGVGAEGTPTFQIRQVANTIGLASRQAVAVGRDGVYFANRRGVYRTTGGDPTLLSDILSPLWTQDPDVYYQGEPINLGALEKIRALWTMEKFYLAVPTGVSPVNDRLLVRDAQHEWWSIYDVPAAALISFRSSDIPEVHFGYSSGPNRVGHLQIGAVADRGQPITSRWRSGWFDYGSSQQRTIRETKIWGSGAINVEFSVDFNRTLLGAIDTPLGAEMDWPLNGAGTWDDWLGLNSNFWPGAGQISGAIVRRAVRGTVFSTQFSNSPSAQTWAVHRVARHLREVREASIP